MRGVIGLVAVLGVFLAAPAFAQTNVTLGDIKAKSVKFQPRAAPALGPSECVVYLDAASAVLTATCKNASGTGFSTVVLGVGCSSDAAGNLSCNSFISANQNLLASPAINRLRMFVNAVDLTPNPSCTDYGQAGVMTLLDIDEGAGVSFVLCNGTTMVDVLNATVRVLYPNGWHVNSGNATQVASDDDCACWQFSTTAPMTSIEKLTVQLTTIDGDDTTEFGIFSEDGQREYYEGGVVDIDAAPGVGYKTNANALAACTTVPCASGAQPLPRGNYWLCQALNSVTSNLSTFRGTAAGGFTYGATMTLADACVAGEIPATITPASIAWDATIAFPAFAISDE